MSTDNAANASFPADISAMLNELSKRYGYESDEEVIRAALAQMLEADGDDEDVYAALKEVDDALNNGTSKHIPMEEAFDKMFRDFGITPPK
jgi:Arc/MetJ-type ribon-helix-helix transcriptional regulator